MGRGGFEATMEQVLSMLAARRRSPVKAADIGRESILDSCLLVTKGLMAVTPLTGLLGGYFHYLNFHEQKVGEQAKAVLASSRSDRPRRRSKGHTRNSPSPNTHR